MTEYKPGTVAKATVRGVKDTLVFRVGWGYQRPWLTPVGVEGFSSHRESAVTDIRPLVLLDLEDPAETVRHLRATSAQWDVVEHIADAIEAQTKPARIDEPGLWGVVEATRRGAHPLTLKWLRVESGFWYCTIGSAQVAWDELVDPVLIREGLEPEDELGW